MAKSNTKGMVKAELSNKTPDSYEYETVLKSIVKKIKESQTRAMVAVNCELITLYWDIGKMINTEQKNASWGSSVVDQLTKDLQKSFPGMKGFSSRNICGG